MNDFARPGLAEEKLPPVSTADNGKVLTVDSGVWAAKEQSALPAVTSEDNGDVLTVVDGVWGKTASGGGVFAVGVTWDGSTGTLDKTAAEILAAAQTQPVVIVDSGEGYTYLNPLTGVSVEDGAYGFVITGEGSYTCFEASAGTDYPTSVS